MSYLEFDTGPLQESHHLLEMALLSAVLESLCDSHLSPFAITASGPLQALTVPFKELDETIDECLVFGENEMQKKLKRSAQEEKVL